MTYRSVSTSLANLQAAIRQTFRSRDTNSPEREVVIETQFDDGDCWGWTRFDDTVELLERAP